MSVMRASMVACAMFIFTESSAVADTRLSCYTPQFSAEIETELKHALPGNSSDGHLTRCELLLANNSQSVQLSIQLRMHIKQRACNNKPWPLSGRWCVDEYNNWADGFLTIRMNADCSLDVIAMYVDITGGPGGIYGNIVKDLFQKTSFGRREWQRMRSRFENRIRQQARNSELGQFCPS